jgi:hypothetical protein
MSNLITTVQNAEGVSLWEPGEGKTITIPSLRRENGLNATWRDYFSAYPNANDRIGEIIAGRWQAGAAGRYYRPVLQAGDRPVLQAGIAGRSCRPVLQADFAGRW